MPLVSKLLILLSLSLIQARAYSWKLLCAAGTTAGGAQNGTWSRISPAGGGGTWKKIGACGGGGTQTNTATGTSTNTAVSCGGVQYAGFCWYQTGFSAISCTALCASHGGVNDATKTYAGSGGSDANCAAVQTALGMSNNAGSACALAVNGNGVTAGAMPCISACGPDPWSGCNLEIAAQPASSGTLRRRCTDGTTTYVNAALEAPPPNTEFTSLQQSLVCACNN